jgi:hypothetical protein
MERTIKGVRGDLKQERQIAFVNALKEIDYEKEYQQALRDIAEAMFDMEFDENNCPTLNTNEG